MMHMTRNTHQGRRPGRLLILSGLLVLTLAALAALTGCAGEEAGQTALAEPVVQEEAALPVTVAAVVRQDMDKTLTLGGLLRPQEEVALMGGGTGSRIVTVAVELGDYVTKGQTILTQDMRDLNIGERELQLSRAQLQDSYDKSKALYDAGALAESTLTELADRIEGIDLQLETLRLSREKMAVTATIDGIVSALPVVEGQMAAASTVVAQVVNIDRLLLDVQIGESYILGIAAGDEMEVFIPAIGSQPVSGRVKTVPPTINAQTRAYTVTLEVDNPDLAIKGGMYGETRLVVERHEDALVIPQFAILELEDGSAVFVAENGAARQRAVTVGLTLGNEAQILSGLAEGEQVIVEGQYSATEGRPLQVLAKGGVQ